ncbi:MAG TPA: S8 family serine peptidase [Thermoleophilaceae bacterium]|nr:S8 family serine peptidase [Thermoleophilaceae bacterium]
MALAAALALLVFAATAPAAQYVPGQVLVKFKSGTSQTLQQSVLNRAGAVRIGRVAGVGAHVLRVAGDARVAAQALDRLAAVRYAEVNKILHTTAVPNDPRFGEMYGLDRIDAPEGWDLAGLGTFPTAGGVKVGIVDTGIQANHPDLVGKTVDCAQSRGTLIFAGQIREGSCADDNDHGTHVAGTIAANTNNGIGVAGVAFNARLSICRALGGPLGTGATSDVANCINWLATKGVKVISMSLGGGASSTLQTAVRNAWKNGGATGAVVIAAAGNDGNSAVNYPAGYAEVVSVAATDEADARASYSNANADVEISAPGSNVLSTVRGGGYAEISGTSMATPHVSGVTAVLWQLNPGATAATIRSRLTAAVNDLGPAGRDPQFGFGRVNLCRAAGGAC